MNIMTPTPFTPAVLNRVIADTRNGVRADLIAGELGWTLERLRRVARAHGIELDAYLAPLPMPQAPMQTPTQAESVFHFAGSVRAGTVNAAASLPAIISALPPGQADALRVLAREARSDYVGRVFLAGRLGITPKAAASLIVNLRNKLSGTRYAIASRMAFGGGYRLVERSEESAA